MTLQFAKPGAVALHYRLRPGPDGALPIVLLNSLGTDFRIWDGVAGQLPDAPILQMDKRGHGLSALAEVSIPLLARDVADLMAHLGLGRALICGVSVGGLIAQQLAIDRPDLVAGLVLCNTGAKIGDDATWNARIEAIRAGGIASIADGILERWFSAGFREDRSAELAGYHSMLTRTDAEGYLRTCAAIRDADLREGTPRIAVPTTCIGGSEDRATPPDLVKALADLIAGSSVDILDGIGHLPCIETPDGVAGHIRTLWLGLA